MIDAIVIGEIIEQYRKHGWTLRRALLSESGNREVVERLASIEVTQSDFDALWFSRKSRPESEAWELRRLSGSPFALVAVIASDVTDHERERALSEVVDKMRAKTFA